MGITKHPNVFCYFILKIDIQNYLSGLLDQVAQHHPYHQSLQDYLWLLETQEAPNQAIPSGLLSQEVLGAQGILYHLEPLLQNRPEIKILSKK